MTSRPDGRRRARTACIALPVEALADRGLQVERFSEGPERLRASPDGGSWELTVTSAADSDGLAVHARGIVEGGADVDATEVVIPCG